MRVIIGVDEAGRGALAGPLVAAAICIVDKKNFPLSQVKDSKLLSDKQRRSYFEIIQKTCDVRFGIVSNVLLDRIGVQAANVLAVDHVIRQFDDEAQIMCDHIGGFHNYTCFLRNIHFFKHGEMLRPEIAAASIAAKVFRDDLMIKLHEQYPEYGFDQHKGYGTERHRIIIQEQGPCPVHRMSFTLQ